MPIYQSKVCIEPEIMIRPTQFNKETTLKLIYHPLYSMNKFVTNKSKLPQDGAQVSLYMGVIGYHVTL